MYKFGPRPLRYVKLLIRIKRVYSQIFLNMMRGKTATNRETIDKLRPKEKSCLVRFTRSSLENGPHPRFFFHSPK